MKSKIKNTSTKAQIDLDICIKNIEKLMEENNTLRERLKYYSHMWGEAYSAYNQPNKRQDERAREALKILGFTKDGKRYASPGIKEVMFYHYLNKTSEIVSNLDEIKTYLPFFKPSNNPMSGQDALIHLSEYYETTPDAVRQPINTYMIKERQRLKDAGCPSDIITTILKTPPKVKR